MSDTPLPSASEQLKRTRSQDDLFNEEMESIRTSVRNELDNCARRGETSLVLCRYEDPLAAQSSRSIHRLLEELNDLGYKTQRRERRHITNGSTEPVFYIQWGESDQELEK